MKHYCYRHIRLDTNTPFYIGIGTKKSNASCLTAEYRRAYVNDSKHRSKAWMNIYNKINGNIDVDILYESDDYDEIKEKEKEFIKLYGRLNKKTGLLVNFTDGGDGVRGFKLSKEAREKISENNRGRIWSKEARKKASLMRKGIPGKPHTKESKLKMRLAHLGKPRSPEYRKKISDSLMGRFCGKNNSWARAVIQLTPEGVFIKEWGSIADAKRALGINNISAVLLGLQNTSGGFKWKYKNV